MKIYTIKESKRAIADMCIEIADILDALMNGGYELDVRTAVTKANTDLQLAFRHLSLAAQLLENQERMENN